MLGSFRAASTLASRAKRPMQSASEAKDCGRILSVTVAVKVAIGCPIHFSHAGFAEHGVMRLCTMLWSMASPIFCLPAPGGTVRRSRRSLAERSVGDPQLGFVGRKNGSDVLTVC